MRLYQGIFIFSFLSPLLWAQQTLDYDELYKQRFTQLKANRGIMTDYSPTEQVEGAKSYKPLPASKHSSIAQKALLQAEKYAKENNSTAFMVFKDGKLQYERYFGDNTANTPLVSKSLSKPLGAIAIGRAIKLGKIKSLEQPVSDFIPQWQNTAKSDVLVKHLLNMHSGFLKQGYSLDPNHPWNTAYLSYEHDKVLINDYPLVDKPGSKYSYNNATAEMVALVIEAATGQRYAEFIGNEVLSKLGAQGGTIWVDREGGLAHSGCCMKLPADSWLRLALLLINKGKVGDEQLISSDFVSAMITPSPHNPHFGLGVWLGQPYAERRGFTGADGGGPQVLHSAPYLDKSLYLFDGNSNQVVYILPSYDMVILRMGNNPPKKPEWDNSYLPNLLIKGLNKP